MTDLHEELRYQIWQRQLAGARIESLEEAIAELVAAAEAALKVVDEAYVATGHIRVADTSVERLAIEAAIRKGRGCI